MADERDAAAADEALPRYSRRALPAQRHLPGRTPRPRASDGWAAQLDPRAPFCCEAFLHGVDLWNHRFFWEAHEAWEDPWRAAGRESPLGRFLQGLILLAAAAVKRELGAAGPARRLAARGARGLRSKPGVQPPFDASAFAAAVDAWVSGLRSAPPPLRLDPLDHE
jgi:hypothetical protein